ncbi:hypothetical protein OPQ81_011985 [Rhizoctonia solani]|nr:hypothetical protein OPQ81_011985 [Rhizoctonia solani]
MLRLENKVILWVDGNEVEEGTEEEYEDEVSNAGSVSNTDNDSMVPTSITWEWPEQSAEGNGLATATNPSNITAEGATSAQGRSSPLFTDVDSDEELLPRTVD